jgi:hypothetical protein
LGRYRIWLGLAVAVAFATTGIAVASEPHAQTQAVAASFEAEMKRSKTHMCKGSDGTYHRTHAVYWGTAKSDNPLLAGRIRLLLKGFYNADEKLGKVSGEVHIRNEEMDRRAHARLVAVNSNGALEGILVGVAGRPRAKLVANFTATLSESGISGELGGGSSGNLAVLFSRGCRHREPDATAKEQRKQERLEQKEQKVQPAERPGK